MLSLFIDNIMESFLADYRQKRHGPTHQVLESSSSVPGLQSSLDPPGNIATALSQENASKLHKNEPSTPILEEGSESEEGFSIPELPIGRELVINILSTWGDRFYVGLTGLEIFTALGEPAKIQDVSIAYM